MADKIPKIIFNRKNVADDPLYFYEKWLRFHRSQVIYCQDCARSDRSRAWYWREQEEKSKDSVKHLELTIKNFKENATKI